MLTFTNIVTGADAAIVGTAADGAAIVATSSSREGLYGRRVGRRRRGRHREEVRTRCLRGEHTVRRRRRRRASAREVRGYGPEPDGTGVFGYSGTREGVSAVTDSENMAAVAALLNEQGTGAAVYGEKAGDAGGAPFVGRVRVTRDLSVGGEIQMTGGDLAEQFDLADGGEAVPGRVMVVVGDDRVRQSEAPDDTRVAGVVCGAGSYRPGLVLDARVDSARCAVALTGKVWCWVDADRASVALGDLLTTLFTEGTPCGPATRAARSAPCSARRSVASGSGRALLQVLVGLR